MFQYPHLIKGRRHLIMFWLWLNTSLSVFLCLHRLCRHLSLSDDKTKNRPFFADNFIRISQFAHKIRDCLSGGVIIRVDLEHFTRSHFSESHAWFNLWVGTYLPRQVKSLVNLFCAHCGSGLLYLNFKLELERNLGLFQRRDERFEVEDRSKKERLFRFTMEKDYF